MEKDTTHLMKRAERFKTILTAEGFLVGAVAGLVVLLYRVILEYAGKGMNKVLDMPDKNLLQRFYGLWHCLLSPVL